MATLCPRCQKEYTRWERVAASRIRLMCPGCGYGGGGGERAPDNKNLRSLALSVCNDSAKKQRQQVYAQNGIDGVQWEKRKRGYIPVFPDRRTRNKAARLQNFVELD